MQKPLVKFIKTGLPARFLLITCGLPATGKTASAERIAGARGCLLLRTDLIRREVLGREEIFDENAAADMDRRMQIYDEMFRRAEEALNKNACVILDATFVKQALRLRAAGIAARHKTTFVIVETICPQDIAIKRILGRTRDNYVSNALTEQAYLDNKKRFEPVNVNDFKNAYPGLEVMHLTVDTAGDSPEDWFVIK